MTIFANRSTYDEIADEYYSDLHVTSRNFDKATKSFFKDHIFKFETNGIFLEIGAGTGRAPEFLKINPERIIFSDLSRLMLCDSLNDNKSNRIQFNAFKIPFQSSIFSAIFAFLFDPFNLPNLYKEVHRVLKRGAPFIGTLPHAVWGTNLRNLIKINHSTTIFRKFNSENGEYVRLNSFLSSNKEIFEILNNLGFNKISIKDLYLPRDVKKVSEHISMVADKLNVSKYDLPIILLIMGVKE